VHALPDLGLFRLFCQTGPSVILHYCIILQETNRKASIDIEKCLTSVDPAHWACMVTNDLIAVL